MVGCCVSKHLKKVKRTYQVLLLWKLYRFNRLKEAGFQDYLSIPLYQRYRDEDGRFFKPDYLTKFLFC